MILSYKSTQLIYPENQLTDFRLIGAWAAEPTRPDSLFIERNVWMFFSFLGLWIEK